jgi:hypothetical protein
MTAGRNAALAVAVTSSRSRARSTSSLARRAKAASSRRHRRAIGYISAAKLMNVMFQNQPCSQRRTRLSGGRPSGPRDSCHRDAVDFLERALGLGHPDRSAVQFDLGIARVRLGENDRAIEALESATASSVGPDLARIQ